MKLFNTKSGEFEGICSAVVLAAGSSTRMGEDKTTLMLDGIPVIVRSIMAFQDVSLVNEIIVVTQMDKIQQIADLCVEYKLDKVKRVIAGGATRMESSLAGVSSVNKKAKVIAIHDAARPLVSGKLIRDLINTADEYNAAVPAIASTDTLRIKDSAGFIGGFVDREQVVRIQTPQVFKADIIKGALSSAVKKNNGITDDATAVSALGFKVKLVEGEMTNIKLTVPSDIIVAESYLKSGKENA